MGELASARAIADEADRKRTAALVEAVGHLVPRPDLGPCPIAIPVVGSEAMLVDREPVDAPVDWRSIRANQMMVVNKTAVTSTPSVRRKYIAQMLDFEQSRLNAPRPGDNDVVADVIRWARHYADPKNTSWELVVVADRRIDAKLIDRDKFRSGLILGTAFVYSYVDERVACAGSVLAENSDMITAHGVKTTDGKDFDLQFDLDNEAFRSAARAMYVAGPAEDWMPSDAGADRADPADGGTAPSKGTAR